MDPVYHNIFRWILDNWKGAKYDFCQSGMTEVFLRDAAIDLSYEKFYSLRFMVEEDFKEIVSEIYDIDKDQLISTVGGTEGITLASLYLKRHSECINVAVPEYEPMYRVPETLGFNVKRIDAYKEITPTPGDSLSTTFPNNPTGDMKEDRNLNNFFDGKHSVFIDETFREFTFPKKGKTLLTEYPDVLTSTTLTKFFGAGPWRVGWIMGDREKIREIKELRFLSTGSVNLFSLYAATKILKNRDYYRKLVSTVLERNRKIVKEGLKSMGLKFTSPENTTFTFVETEKDSQEIASKLLDKYGILVTPGEYFGVKHGYRLCFTGDTEILKEGMEQLRKFYENEQK
jgi:aspartate/methionine/tyrosine aminotransferase